ARCGTWQCVKLDVDVSQKTVPLKACVPMLLLLQLTFHIVQGQQESAPSRLDEHVRKSAVPSQCNRADSVHRALEYHLDSGIMAFNKSIDSTYALIMSPGEYHQQALRLYEMFDAGILRDTLVIGDANAKLRTRFNSLKAEVHER